MIIKPSGGGSSEKELEANPKDNIDENIIKGDKDKRISSISQNIANLLVIQIAHEMYNHSIYRTMANYYSVKGYLGLEDYYLKRSHEEYNHAEWIRVYLHDNDVIFNYPNIDAVTIKLVNMEDAFIQTVDKEIDTTLAIINIAKESFSCGDLLTFNFLQKLIAEQIEEESTSRTVLSIALMPDTWLIKEQAILEFYNK